jgi:hypothetical protein
MGARSKMPCFLSVALRRSALIKWAFLWQPCYYDGLPHAVVGFPHGKLSIVDGETKTPSPFPPITLPHPAILADHDLHGHGHQEVLSAHSLGRIGIDHSHAIR